MRGRCPLTEVRAVVLRPAVCVRSRAHGGGSARSLRVRGRRGSTASCEEPQDGAGSSAGGAQHHRLVVDPYLCEATSDGCPGGSGALTVGGTAEGDGDGATGVPQN